MKAVRLLLLATFLTVSSLAAQPLTFPSNAPGADELVKRVFSELRFYFYQLSLNSIITYTDNHCRIFHYKKSAHSAHDGNPIDTKLQFCIVRSVTQGMLHESLRFHVDGRMAGKIIISRTQNVTPTPDENIFRFELPGPSKSSKFVIETQVVDLRLDFEQSSAQRTLHANIFNQTISIVDRIAADRSSRAYTFESKSRSYSLQAVVDRLQTSYYVDTMAERGAPHYFNQMIGSSLRMFSSAGTIIKRRLINGYGWPDI